MHANRAEWLEKRRQRIGASDAPVIMGVSPWKTPYQLWQEKLGLSTDKEPSTAMLRGLDLEEKALKAFEKLSGLDMIAQQERAHSTYTWMWATLDGIDISGKNAVEIKCPGQTDHQSAVDGHIPEKYIPQLQHQMAVADLERIFYFSFDGENGIVLEAFRDDAYIKELINAEQRFWDCVENLIAPEQTSRDYQLMHDSEWIALSGAWKDINAQLKDLQSREEDIRERLIAKCGDLNCHGNGIKITRVVRKGNVEYSKIPQLETVDLEQFRKEPTSYWKVSAA